MNAGPPSSTPRTVVVTGGSHGIGRAIVSQVLEKGAQVAVLDLLPSADRGQPRLMTAIGDVVDRDAVRDFFDAVEARFGVVNILINNAAIYPPHAVLASGERELRRILDTNLFGPLLMVERFVQSQRRTPCAPARVVNITSRAAQEPDVEAGGYAVSKAALELLTRVLALELAPLGITVNSIAPGYIDVSSLSDVNIHRVPASARRALINDIPVGRAGRAADVVNAVEFLCSPDSSFITGATIAVDGGAGAGRSTSASMLSKGEST